MTDLFCNVQVLDEGHIAEFDTPHNLLTNDKSLFHRMAQQSGPEEFNQLLKHAAAGSS